MRACTIMKRHIEGAKKSGTVIGFDQVVVRACFGAFKNQISSLSRLLLAAHGQVE